MTPSNDTPTYFPVQYVGTYTSTMVPLWRREEREYYLYEP